jgi:lipoate-protein ligase B
LKYIDLGHKEYKEVWGYQKILHKKRVDKQIGDILLLVEHDPVVTMGKSAKTKNLLISPERLRERNIAYFEIERGGDVTYHGPGQLVGYLIVDIKNGFAGIRPYIEKLEEVVIETLKDFNISARRRNQMIGVWTDQGKICSIGVAVKRWVSFHGFALNVNTDLSYFHLIIPCGIRNIKMTSMQVLLSKEIPLSAVKEQLVKNCGGIFGQRMERACLERTI